MKSYVIRARCGRIKINNYVRKIDQPHPNAALSGLPRSYYRDRRAFRPLDDVLPYLATLPGVIAYNPHRIHSPFAARWDFMTLYSDKVYITQVKDTEEGLELLKALVDAINATWEGRASWLR